MKPSIFFIVFFALLCFFGTAAWGQTNYQFTSAAGPVTIATTGTVMTWTTTIANDDEYSSAADIFTGGETFTYAGTVFTQFQVSTNGFVRLGTGLASATPADALGGVLRGIIAPLWDDLAVSATATDVFYNISGSTPDQVLTVTWRNVKWNKTAPAANAEFQIKLHETTNVIEFEYGAMGTPTAGAASIGLADNTVITTAGSATGKFFSINVGGIPTARRYHQSMCFAFNAINNAPDAGTVLTFTPVTPSAIAGGTYTIGGSSPTYQSLSDAANALNIHGIAGPVTLNVRAGTYDDIFHLISVAGTSATNTITLKNESGSVTLTPLNGSGSSTSAAAATSDAIIRMEGTQYTTVQGLSLVDNGQATVVLKFEGAVYLGNSVLNGTMISGGRFNTFRNLTIDMKTTTGINHAGSTGFRYFTTSSTETDTGKATSYNRIENCTVTGFWRSAWKNFGVSGTNPDRGNVMTGCTMGDVSIPTGTGSDIRAIEIDCQANLTIDNNTIQNIDAAIMTTNNIYGVWLNPASSTTNVNSGTIIIRNNTVKNLSNSGAGTTTGFAVGIASNGVATGTEFQIYKNKIFNIFSNGSTTCRAEGVFLNVATATSSIIKLDNNMVSDVRAPRSTSGPAVRGFDLQNGGGGGTFSVYFNSIALDDATPPTAVNHQSACLYFASFATSTLDLRNNILINTMSTNGTGRAIALYASTNANLLRLASTTDYNNYYIGTGSATRGVSTDVTSIYQDLAAHQAAVASGGLGGPRDVNSKSVAVTFTSSADLHLSGGSIGDQNLAGTPVATYTTDIDGDLRDAGRPYIGADERPEAYLPIQLASFTGVAISNTSVRLDWMTLSEINNLGFYVQRRHASEQSFTELPNSFVPGHGTTLIPQYYTFTDNTAGPGRWFYRLQQVDLNGSRTLTDPIQVDVLTGVKETVPREFALSQNYPNPFNPETNIKFSVETAGKTTLEIYNALGQKVATMFDEVAEPGRYYIVRFSGLGLASGVYFYTLESGAETRPEENAAAQVIRRAS